ALGIVSVIIAEAEIPINGANTFLFFIFNRAVRCLNTASILAYDARSNGGFGSVKLFMNTKVSNKIISAITARRSPRLILSRSSQKNRLRFIIAGETFI